MDNIILTQLSIEELTEKLSSKILTILKHEDSVNDQDQKPREYLTQEEVMEMCRIKAKSTLWNWSKQGLLVPKASAGRRPLYRHEDVIEFLNRRNKDQQSQSNY